MAYLQGYNMAMTAAGGQVTVQMDGFSINFFHESNVTINMGGYPGSSTSMTITSSGPGSNNYRPSRLRTHNTPFTYSRPSVVNERVTYNGPVTYNACVTHYGHVTHNGPVYYNAAVTYDGHVTYNGPVSNSNASAFDYVIHNGRVVNNNPVALPYPSWNSYFQSYGSYRQDVFAATPPVPKRSRIEAPASASTVNTSGTCSVVNEHPPMTCYDNLITLVIGQQKQCFQIHRGLLEWHSPVLGTMLARLRGNTLTIRDGDVGVYQRFYSWLYNNKLSRPGENGDSGDILPLSYELYCNIFVFAETYQIPALNNRVVDEVRNTLTLGSTPPPQPVKYIYTKTHSGSALRRLVAYVLANHLSYNDYLHAKRFLPMDAVTDVLGFVEANGGVWRYRPLGELACVDVCQFHDHAAAVTVKQEPRA
ncbi:hypothetical protein BDV96DRAFT_689939 [Lophiotrema nucula]|uniref:BTB domain-containing protein n=1 Tax=Lophiotrema nucula TaxID=690887 RepID=A0A6A5YY82_9PLEO|nr:hypothetical protein BDV96DRAFT_689939 [Lophiotrema nucula]